MTPGNGVVVKRESNPALGAWRVTWDYEFDLSNGESRTSSGHCFCPNKAAAIKFAREVVRQAAKDDGVDLVAIVESEEVR